MPRDYRAPRDYGHTYPEPPGDQPATPDALHCPGKCNAAYRAAEARYQDGGADHDLEPRPGQPVWCAPCVTEVRGALTDWQDLAVRLQEEVESGVSAAMAEYVSGSKNRPVHDHEAASFLLDEAAEWLGSWEDTLRADLDLGRRKRAATAVGVIRAATGILSANLEWHLAGRPREQYFVAEEFGLDLLRYHRRAQLLTGTQDVEPVRVIGVPCPMCDRKALEHELEASASRRAPLRRYRRGEDDEPLSPYRPLGPGGGAKLTETAVTALEGAATGYVKCRHCKPAFRMTGEEYTRWTKLLAAGDAVRALATREKLAEVFGNSVPAQYARAAQ
jgi:hypothetical protein